MKLVINSEYGGFYVDEKAAAYMREHGYEGEFRHDIPRNHPLLVAAVEAGLSYPLKVVEVDTTRPWYVEEYDGRETVVYPSAKNRGVALLPRGRKR